MSSRKQSGFTLLEVLLGMSLLSVMMLLLFGSLRVCVQNWDAGESKFARVSQVAMIQNFFISHLQNALPLQDDLTENKQFSFQGNENSIQFVSSMPASAGRLGLQLFTVAFNGSKHGDAAITVNMRPFFASSEGKDWKIDEVVILKQVNSLRFSYFGGNLENPEEEPSWQATWLEKNQTPLLVKIEIELASGEIWPEQIVALKVDNSAVSTNPFGIANGRFTR
jgi:general secretion pathway protein J